MPLRKISKCHMDFVEIIHKIAEELNLKNIEYVIKFGCEDIDSFHNGLYSVQIKGLRDGQIIKHCVVVKWQPDREVRSAIKEFYIREITIFQRVVPKFLEIQRHFKVIEGLRIKFPNCIFMSNEHDKETVAIMALLNGRKGYRVHDRFHKKDLNHAVLVMKYLAKLHALSFVLENSNPEEFDKIKKSYHKDGQYSDPERVSKPMKCFYDASVNVISDPVAKAKLKGLGPNILSVLYKCTLPVPRYSAICHGDCWNNNILYSYKGQRPVDVILIDYQLTRYASPVTDIAYFMYMSTEKELREKHYETLLEIYYGTLEAVLRECSLKIEDIYPKEIFKSHLQKYSVLGLVEALISMMIITAPSEEALKMTEIKYQFGNEEFCESQCKIWFKTRVNDVVQDFFSRNYSLDTVLK
ncbi:putative Juvenile hormone-inducible protein [Operophtera brumata]|uniref:Putative Juvenile hormone-inducible protein n=1 Tax=Operophtera brumata TaxID=104452 RepID=A0A0L7LUY7_OPEBR|nr:putative Juvenile hormone-inducible protein [Operophtera brumata]